MLAALEEEIPARMADRRRKHEYKCDRRHAKRVVFGLML